MVEDNENDAPLFVSPERFAELTSLSPLTVRKLVRQQKLAAYRTSEGKGGSILIPRSEIQRWLEEAEAWRTASKPIVSAEPPSEEDLADEDGDA